MEQATMLGDFQRHFAMLSRNFGEMFRVAEEVAPGSKERFITITNIADGRFIIVMIDPEFATQQMVDDFIVHLSQKTLEGFFGTPEYFSGKPFFMLGATYTGDTKAFQFVITKVT